MTIWLRKIEVSESPRTFLKEVRNHDWQVQAGIVRTACCTALMDDFSMTLTETYPNYLVDRATVLPKYLNDHFDFHLVGQGGESVGRRESLSKYHPGCFSLHPKALKKNRSYEALWRVLCKYKFLILLFTEEKKGHFLCPLQWISCRKAVKEAICKRPFCLSPRLKHSAFSFSKWWNSLLVVVNIARTLLIPST